MGADEAGDLKIGRLVRCSSDVEWVRGYLDEMVEPVALSALSAPLAARARCHLHMDPLSATWRSSA